jgi:hypothetical protein
MLLLHLPRMGIRVVTEYAEFMDKMSAISGFRCDIDEICILVGYYAASNGNPLPTFQTTYRSQDP